MTDIELVIKVPKEYYEFVLKRCKEPILLNAFKNGTVLPKGHGTIKDTDELYNIFKEKCDAYNINNLSFMSDMDMNFDLAPTIIEADKEE